MANKITFNMTTRVTPTTGKLVYEYNPFRNLRISDTKFKYNSKIYESIPELYNTLVSDKAIQYQMLLVRSNKELGYYDTVADLINDSTSIKSQDIDILNFSRLIEKINNWVNINKLIVVNEETNTFKIFENLGDLPEDYSYLRNQKLANHASDIQVLEAGTISDFETDQLNFDITHPVNILPQSSYDGTVNLIINDGINIPRLVNSRFSSTGNSQYEVIDRFGNNDTNIYDYGNKFDISTSLYKLTRKIAKIEYLGDSWGGNVPVGNYHFYFKLEDADGNQTDFIGESKLVQIFKGNSPKDIEGGFREEASNKKISFYLSNIDSAYQYVRVYYTRASSDLHENYTTAAYEIIEKYKVNSNLACYITFTGNENQQQVSSDDINARYQIYDAVKTQEFAKNMLFLANVEQQQLHYLELQNLSLHFLPRCDTEQKCDIDKLGPNYDIGNDIKNTYYDSKFIYNRTGYWNHEIYRFGVVFIYNNGTISPVFNTRGISGLNSKTEYTSLEITNDGKVAEILYDENNFLLKEGKQNEKENIKGVVQIDTSDIGYNNIIGITFDVKPEVLQILQTYNISGLFFVRQKRIPTILCQAYTIGSDQSSSYLPVIPYDEKYMYESLVDNKSILTHNIENRLRELNTAKPVAALCPEYDVDYPYYNSLFNGGKYTYTLSDHQSSDKTKLINDRHFFLTIPSTKNLFNNQVRYTNIIGVEDNVKLVAIDDLKFRARAGEAEDALQYEFLSSDPKMSAPNNITRGSFGPYLGLTGIERSGQFIDIRIPEYNISYLLEYFKMRYRDNSSYYSISDRYSIEELQNQGEEKISIGPEYSGDCFICQFTHRINRNFQSPSAPTNDKIVYPETYKNGYKYIDEVYIEDEENKINLGDLNAVKMGLWITFPIKSSINLNIRSVDSSNVDEVALFGHKRTFYPHTPLLTDGTHKLPEALCINKGLTKLMSERVNVELPTVPAYYTRYANRVAYSEINIQDQFINNSRIFLASSYRDYTNKYGAIVKLVNVKDDLICVCEHGILGLPINEKILINDTNQNLVNINTHNVLPEVPLVISDTYGSQWPESIIKTEKFVYGFDTQAKRIWRTNGNTVEIISDLHIQEFLNGLQLLENETFPIIGIRNVKTHYNKFKNDIMFTFYNYVNGFEEVAWNICFNEVLNKWITFYSWLPSASENIGNIFFSFDYNTSKYVSKLGICTKDSNFGSGIMLDSNIIPMNAQQEEIKVSNTNNHLGYIEANPKENSVIKNWIKVGQLFLDESRTKDYGNIEYTVYFNLERDNYGNYKNFYIVKDNNSWYLYFTGNVIDLCSELYQIESEGTKITDPKNKDNQQWKSIIANGNFELSYNEAGRRIYLDEDNQVRGDKLVCLLNISAQIDFKDTNISYKDFIHSQKNFLKTHADYLNYTIAIIPQYNLRFLSTNFWKHGQAGIIDISDSILPTHWYGKQHPFEFEFVVADNPDKHKIFDNLEIISNKAVPESFHYEIVGDCYDFAKDKKNMYIRQEATKELYQYNGSNIVFDDKYKMLNSEHRLINKTSSQFDKSTIFPLYYFRQDSVNKIEDSYHLYGHKDDYGPSDKNFSALAGAEIVHYKNLNEYRIWNHTKAVDIAEEGLLRGNMQYKGDKWNVQINPINFIQKNETKDDWKNKYKFNSSDEDTYNQVPAELNLFKDKSDIPSQRFETNKLELPNTWTRNIVSWSDYERLNKEVKLKDKYIKIRIRYSGNDLAIISAIRTLYSISYASI